jgi:hypothetical protein
MPRLINQLGENMNKTQIKNALQVKRDLKLEEIRNEYNKIRKEQEAIFIEESVGLELSNFNKDLQALKNSKQFKDFFKSSKTLKDKVSGVANLYCLNNYDKKHFFGYVHQIIDGTFDYDVYTTVNRYTGREVDRKLCVAHEKLITDTNREFDKLQSFLSSTTAKKFIECIKEMGISLEIEEVGNYQLPAPKFNVDLIK